MKKIMEFLEELLKKWWRDPQDEKGNTLNNARKKVELCLMEIGKT